MAMTFTLNHIVLLGLMLLIGLFLGLMMSGRGKYKRLWREERILHDQTRKDRDARIAEIETQRARTPIVPATPSHVADARRGDDDLTAIRTISSQDAVALNEAGYHRYAQIAAMNAEQQAVIEARLGRMPGLIARDEWPQQARLLEAGERDEHLRLYEKRRTPV
jgi:predicted flap endonuclease-1-like 5' DNA nuclease